MKSSPGWIPGEDGVVRLSRTQAKELAAIRAELASIDLALPGSLVIRQGRCGKPACACHGDPPRMHGPFRSWTRKVAGKTATRLLSEDQLGDYQAFFDNHRRLKDLIRRWETLSLEVVEADPRWPAR